MDKLKVSGRNVSTSKTKCIDKVDKVLVSFTQIQKKFLKGRLKRVRDIVYTNFLLMHNEDIDNMIQDAKYQLDKHNIKLGAQCIQYCKVVKIRYILFLITKVDVNKQAEFLKEKLKTILGCDIHFALVVSKINDGTIFKGKSSKQERTTVKRKRGKRT